MPCGIIDDIYVIYIKGDLKLEQTSGRGKELRDSESHSIAGSEM